MSRLMSTSSTSTSLQMVTHRVAPGPPQPAPRPHPTLTPWLQPAGTRLGSRNSSSSLRPLLRPRILRRPPSKVSLRPLATMQRLHPPPPQVPTSPTPRSASPTMAPLSLRWPPGLSLSTETTKPPGHTTPTPARPQGCIQHSPTWALHRGLCTLP